MELQSVCALDCPDCCSLLVTIENGKATKLRGNPNHPVTRGFLCAKVSRYLDREYHPDRLLYPQKRSGPKGNPQFQRIGWDEALDTIAARLTAVAKEYGSEAILPYSYAGNMGYLNSSGMDRRFFHRLGASRLDRTICSAAGGAGLMASLGYRYGTEPEQFRHSKLILAWAANIMGTNVHLWPFIVEARRNGAKFYVIDPVRNRTGELADRVYGIYPGSDMALALGMMHVILAENLQDDDYIANYSEGVTELKQRVSEYTPTHASQMTGIPAQDIVTLAREYATTRPAAIRLNYGVQRSERGGNTVRAIAMLPALTGSWREVGGGLQLTTSGAFQVNTNALQMPELQQKSLGREARIVNMIELGKALAEVTDPPIKAMVVYNSNPAAVAPHQNKVMAGLRRDDLFTVVLEQFQTDTADYADILLPATTFLENTDLYFAYGHYHLQLARPALAAPGECRNNFEIFRQLAARMGFDDPCFRDSEDDVIRAVLGSDSPFVKGITIEELDAKRSVRLNVAPNGDPFLPFAKGNFGTSDGKLHFHAETLEYKPPVESRHGSAALTAKYPLEMVSSKHDDTMNSTFGNRDDVDRETARVWMNAEDASPRGITDGDVVRVWNDRGSLRLIAYVNGGVRPGVVRIPAVRWNKRSPEGVSVNVLTSDGLSDIGGSPVFYSCLVQVERCGD